MKLEAPQKLWAHSFPGQWGRHEEGSLFFHVPLIFTSLVSLFTEWWVRRITFSPTHYTQSGTGNISFSTRKQRPRCYWKCRYCNCGHKSNCSYKSLQLLNTKKKKKSAILWATATINCRWNILSSKLGTNYWLYFLLQKCFIYIICMCVSGIQLILCKGYRNWSIHVKLILYPIFALYA